MRKFKLAVIATLLVGSFALTDTATAGTRSASALYGRVTTPLKTRRHTGQAAGTLIATAKVVDPAALVQKRYISIVVQMTLVGGGNVNRVS